MAAPVEDREIAIDTETVIRGVAFIVNVSSAAKMTSLASEEVTTTTRWNYFEAAISSLPGLVGNSWHTHELSGIPGGSTTVDWQQQTEATVRAGDIGKSHDYLRQSLIIRETVSGCLSVLILGVGIVMVLSLIQLAIWANTGIEFLRNPCPLIPILATLLFLVCYLIFAVRAGWAQTRSSDVKVPLSKRKLKRFLSLGGDVRTLALRNVLVRIVTHGQYRIASRTDRRAPELQSWFLRPEYEG